MRTGQGWLYLATVIDLCTRMVVGWAIAEHMRASLVCSALRMARDGGYLAAGAVFHSDRGSQGGINRSSQHLDRVRPLLHRPRCHPQYGTHRCVLR